MHTVRGGSAFVVIGDGDTEESFSSDSGNGGRFVAGVDTRNRTREQFAQKLDAKLKKLQRQQQQQQQLQQHQQLQQQRQTVNGNNPSERPLFITTVKTGVFLDPPPDLAVLLGLDSGSPNCRSKRSYYSYTSKPRVLYDNHHRRHCCALNEQVSK